MLLSDRKEVSSYAVSFGIHATTLAVLLFITLPGGILEDLLPIESLVRPEKRNPLDIVEKLDQPNDALVPRRPGSPAFATSSKSPKASIAAKLPENPKIDAELEFIPSPMLPTPGVSALAQSIAPGPQGAPGIPRMLVPGYGPALDQLTTELHRLLRKDKLVVVWLFDESGSMDDDQKRVRKRIGNVFEKLKDLNPKSLNRAEMLTTIASYGRVYQKRTKGKPTADVNEIIAAIDSIRDDKANDKSGIENTFKAVRDAIGAHIYWKKQRKRRIVVIVVTDEAGDDDAFLERAIDRAKAFGTPVYVLGREAVFGSRNAYVRWKAPKGRRIHFLPIHRGPESPSPELLQHDGFRRRTDAHMSGFAPYGLARLCRETGGIFFQMPDEQIELHAYRKWEENALAIGEYMPDLSSKKDYAKARKASRFRRTIGDVAWRFDPRNPTIKKLNLPDPGVQSYSTNPREFEGVVKERWRRILKLIKLYQVAIDDLERVRDLRAKEPSRRWIATYDLMRAQAHWYQLRLYEYYIGMEQFVRRGVQRRPTDNVWVIRESSRHLVLPDSVNEEFFLREFGKPRITGEVVKQRYDEVLEMFTFVIEQHQRTPWAQRAAWEMRRPFGVKVSSSYRKPEKVVPNTGPPNPTPAKPPNL